MIEREPCGLYVNTHTNKIVNRPDSPRCASCAFFDRANERCAPGHGCRTWTDGRQYGCGAYERGVYDGAYDDDCPGTGFAEAEDRRDALAREAAGH